MDKIAWDSPEFLEAVLIWVGWGESSYPLQDASKLVKKYGPNRAEKIMAMIDALEDEFYSFNTRFMANSISEVGEISERVFRKRRPELDEKIIKAFVWCYTL